MIPHRVMLGRGADQGVKMLGLFRRQTVGVGKLGRGDGALRFVVSAGDVIDQIVKPDGKLDERQVRRCEIIQSLEHRRVLQSVIVTRGRSVGHFDLGPL